MDNQTKFFDYEEKNAHFTGNHPSSKQASPYT